MLDESIAWEEHICTVETRKKYWFSLLRKKFYFKKNLLKLFYIYSFISELCQYCIVQYLLIQT